MDISTKFLFLHLKKKEGRSIGPSLMHKASASDVPEKLIGFDNLFIAAITDARMMDNFLKACFKVTDSDILIPGDQDSPLTSFLAGFFHTISTPD